MASFIVNPIVQVVGKVLDRIVPDRVANDAAKAQLAEMITNGELAQMTAQMDIDKQEAASPSLFIAGWRPFIGWICGIALGIDFVFRPLVVWLAASIGHPINTFPVLDMTELWPLITGMLGMGTLRTYEKFKGVAS